MISVRFIWDYNAQPFFMQSGETQAQIMKYMSWIPLIFGSLGLTIGGRLADFFKNRLGLNTSIVLIAAAQIVASPFAAAVLYFDAPVSYFLLIPVYLVGKEVGFDPNINRNPNPNLIFF